MLITDAEFPDLYRSPWHLMPEASAASTALFFHHMDDFLRTLCHAGAAARTFVIINMRDIVCYVNRVVFAVLLAQMASDTARAAGCHNVLALILGIAQYLYRSRIRHQLD